MEQRHERVLKDSGCRTEFETGGVRDLQDGKGRCDLMPLDIVEALIPVHGHHQCVIHYIAKFTETGDEQYLVEAIRWFCEIRGWDIPTMLLEVSMHFEDGAKKYGENNWQKGLPARCYVNSGVRHFMKWWRGDDDEPHDRAFVWNVMALAWTCKHRPGQNNYKGASA